MTMTTKKEINQLRALAVVAKGERIKQLNAYARKNFLGARIMLSAGVAALDIKQKTQVMLMVREFNNFDEGNDPHNEHDMGFFDFASAMRSSSTTTTSAWSTAPMTRATR